MLLATPLLPLPLQLVPRGGERLNCEVTLSSSWSARRSACSSLPTSCCMLHCSPLSTCVGGGATQVNTHLWLGIVGQAGGASCR